MSILILIYIGLIPLLRKRYKAKWLYYIWIVVVLGLIIPFRIHIASAFIQIELPPEVKDTVHNIPEYTSGIINNKVGTFPGVEEMSLKSWYDIAFGIWIIGVVIFCAFHIIKYYRFIRYVKRWSEEIRDELLLNSLQLIKYDLKITSPIKLRSCALITSPMIVGCIKPIILYPSQHLSGEEADYILRHELIHYKRKDLWYKILVFTANAIHWFNPVIYQMSRVIAALCEISCDAEVVKDKDIDKRKRYCGIILNVIKNQSVAQTIFSSNFQEGKKGVKSRITSVMDFGKKKVGIILCCFIIVFTMITGSLLTFTNSFNNSSVRKLLSRINERSITTVIDESGAVYREIDEKSYIAN